MLEEDEKVKVRLDYWHTLFPYMGVRKLRTKLQQEDKLPVGRKRIKRLMDEMGIYTIYPKPKLSIPNKEHKKFPYLLRNKVIQFPNQVWAIDISYIPMAKGFMYLTAIIDWHSRYIVGWSLSDTLGVEPITEALTKAIKTYGIPCIINSDQGSQFTSDDYVNLLKSYRIRQSMDGKGRWIDNVIIERWFRNLKVEDIYINEYASPKALRAGVEEYVKNYNTIRPHQSLNNETPEEFYTSVFKTKKTA